MAVNVRASTLPGRYDNFDERSITMPEQLPSVGRVVHCRYDDKRDGFDNLPGGTWHWPERV